MAKIENLLFETNKQVRSISIFIGTVLSYDMLNNPEYQQNVLKFIEFQISFIRLHHRITFQSERNISNEQIYKINSLTALRNIITAQMIELPEISSRIIDFRNNKVVLDNILDQENLSNTEDKNKFLDQYINLPQDFFSFKSNSIENIDSLLNIYTADIPLSTENLSDSDLIKSLKKFTSEYVSDNSLLSENICNDSILIMKQLINSFQEEGIYFKGRFLISSLNIVFNIEKLMFDCLRIKENEEDFKQSMVSYYEKSIFNFKIFSHHNLYKNEMKHRLDFAEYVIENGLNDELVLPENIKPIYTSNLFDKIKEDNIIYDLLKISEVFLPDIKRAEPFFTNAKNFFFERNYGNFEIWKEILYQQTYFNTEPFNYEELRLIRKCYLRIPKNEISVPKLSSIQQIIEVFSMNLENNSTKLFCAFSILTIFENILSKNLNQYLKKEIVSILILGLIKNISNGYYSRFFSNSTNNLGEQINQILENSETIDSNKILKTICRYNYFPNDVPSKKLLSIIICGILNKSQNISIESQIKLLSYLENNLILFKEQRMLIYELLNDQIIDKNSKAAPINELDQIFMNCLGLIYLNDTNLDFNDSMKTLEKYSDLSLPINEVSMNIRSLKNLMLNLRNLNINYVSNDYWRSLNNFFQNLAVNLNQYITGSEVKKIHLINNVLGFMRIFLLQLNYSIKNVFCYSIAINLIMKTRDFVVNSKNEHIISNFYAISTELLRISMNSNNFSFSLSDILVNVSEIVENYEVPAEPDFNFVAKVINLPQVLTKSITSFTKLEQDEAEDKFKYLLKTMQTNNSSNDIDHSMILKRIYLSIKNMNIKEIGYSDINLYLQSLLMFNDERNTDLSEEMTEILLTFIKKIHSYCITSREVKGDKFQQTTTGIQFLITKLKTNLIMVSHVLNETDSPELNSLLDLFEDVPIEISLKDSTLIRELSVTRLQMRISTVLKTLNIDYNQEFVIGGSTTDFFIQPNTVLEIIGEKNNWGDQIDPNKRYKLNCYKALGYDVATITDEEIKSSIDLEQLLETRING